MKRYYMTAESADYELYEHVGNIRGARTIAQRLANERNETIFINDARTEDIVDCAYPDSEYAENETNKTVSINDAGTEDTVDCAYPDSEYAESKVAMKRIMPKDGKVCHNKGGGDCLCISSWMGTAIMQNVASG